MTLAMGFKCMDGAILCADTQLTIPYPYQTKYTGDKIFGFRELRCAPFFTYAGDVEFSTMCTFRLAKRLRETEKKRATEEVLAEEVRRIHQEYHYAYNAQNGVELQLLVAFRQPDAKVALYVIRGGAISPCSSAIPVCLGIGTPVAMAAMAPFYSGPMSLSEACRTAVYALFQVKSQVEGVGGGTEIMFLRDGRSHAFYHIPLGRESVAVFEQAFEAFQEAIRPVLLTYTTLESDTPSFKRYLKEFSQRMMKLRSRQMAEYRKMHKDLRDAFFGQGAGKH